MAMSSFNAPNISDEKSPKTGDVIPDKKTGSSTHSRRNKKKQKQKQPTEPTTFTESPELNAKSEPATKSKKKRSKKSQNKNNSKSNGLQESTPSTTDGSASNYQDAKKLKKKRKRQMQKERRKQLQLERKRKAEKPRLPVNKITVRNLPPSLSKESFITKIKQTNPQLEAYISEYYYVNGYYPRNQFESSVPSRCYISCLDELNMMQVGRAIKSMTFTDDKPNTSETESKNVEGNGEPVPDTDDLETYIPIIEKSLYQVMPDFNFLGEITIDKWDFLNGKLEEDFAFKRFCESIDSEGKISLPENIFSKGGKSKKKQKTSDQVKDKKLVKNKADGEQKSETKSKKKQKKRGKKKAKVKTDDANKKEEPEKRADSDKIAKDTKKKKKKNKKKLSQKADKEKDRMAGAHTVPT